MPTTNLEDLAARMKALPTADKFRLASALVASGKLTLAEKVGEMAVEDLAALRLLGTRKGAR